MTFISAGRGRAPTPPPPQDRRCDRGTGDVGGDTNSRRLPQIIRTPTVAAARSGLRHILVRTRTGSLGLGGAGLPVAGVTVPRGSRSCRVGRRTASSPELDRGGHGQIIAGRSVAARRKFLLGDRPVWMYPEIVRAIVSAHCQLPYPRFLPGSRGFLLGRLSWRPHLYLAASSTVHGGGKRRA